MGRVAGGYNRVSGHVAVTSPPIRNGRHKQRKGVFTRVAAAPRRIKSAMHTFKESATLHCVR